MLFERDLEVEVRALREARASRTRQDTQALMNSWRAIARSHRLLDREFYRPCNGELVVRRMGMAGTGETGDGRCLPGRIRRAPRDAGRGIAARNFRLEGEFRWRFMATPPDASLTTK
jgi:hypothetical protein